MLEVVNQTCSGPFSAAEVICYEMLDLHTIIYIFGTQNTVIKKSYIKKVSSNCSWESPVPVQAGLWVCVKTMGEKKSIKLTIWITSSSFGNIFRHCSIF